MGTMTMVTVQEFLALAESDEQCRELIGGEVVCMGHAHIPHEVVKKNLNKILVVWLAQDGIGELFPETSYRLDEHNVLMPDLSVLFSGRLSPGSTGLIPDAPDVAIEVVSSEPAARLSKKIELYLSHGTKSVWAVFPEQQVVWIYNAAGQGKRFDRTQTLEDPAALPGFSTTVSAIFERL